MNKKQKDISLCVRTAKSFLKFGKLANEYDLKKEDPDDMDIATSIVNTSFACELSIKAILLILKVQIQNTHRLDKLFEMIPTKEAQQLNMNFDQNRKYEGTLLGVIQHHSQSFNKWRYIYEPQNFRADAYIDNLILAAEVLIEFADNLYQNV